MGRAIITSTLPNWSQQDSRHELGEGWFTGDHLGNLANIQFTYKFPTGNSNDQWSPQLYVVSKSLFIFFYSCSCSCCWLLDFAKLTLTKEKKTSLQYLSFSLFRLGEGVITCMCVHVCICVGELCKIHMHVGLYVGREPRLISKMVLHGSSSLLVEARFLNQIQSSPICSDLKFPIPPSKAGIPGRLPVLTQYLHRFWGYELLPVGFHDKH